MRRSTRLGARTVIALASLLALTGCDELMTGFAEAMLMSGGSAFTTGSSGGYDGGTLPQTYSSYNYGPVQSYYDSTMTQMMWNH